MAMALYHLLIFKRCYSSPRDNGAFIRYKIVFV